MFLGSTTLISIRGCPLSLSVSLIMSYVQVLAFADFAF